jgi:hypothetical protein
MQMQKIWLCDHENILRDHKIGEMLASPQMNRLSHRLSDFADSTKQPGVQPL